MKACLPRPHENGRSARDRAHQCPRPYDAHDAAAILNVMQSAYMETVELKGLALNIIRKHAFPNAIAPISMWSC